MMIALRHCRHRVFFLVFAMACTAGIVCAQDDVPASNVIPAVLDAKQAMKLIKVQGAPEYPPVAKVNYLQGRVHLELAVDRTGKVDSVSVVDGNAILAESALRAVRGWTYHPLDTPSGPSGFLTSVTVTFALHFLSPLLVPPEAEPDFLRQVKPPQAVRPPDGSHPEYLVPLRLLLNDQGQVVDRSGMPRERTRFEAACEALRGWKFRPAHWGNLPIASYLNIEVPISEPALARAANFEGR